MTQDILFTIQHTNLGLSQISSFWRNGGGLDTKCYYSSRTEIKKLYSHKAAAECSMEARIWNFFHSCWGKKPSGWTIIIMKVSLLPLISTNYWKFQLHLLLDFILKWVGKYYAVYFKIKLLSPILHTKTLKMHNYDKVLFFAHTKALLNHIFTTLHYFIDSGFIFIIWRNTSLSYLVQFCSCGRGCCYHTFEEPPKHS